MREDNHNRSYTSPAGLFIVVYHVGLLVGLPFYFYFSPPAWGMVFAGIGLLFLTEIGIGAAYHRYYAHRTYTPRKPAEAVLLGLATLALQGSALRWSFEHRLHHVYVDTDRDPYSIKKGFWYAHVLWLFDKPTPIDPKRVPDLMKNRLVVFQHRFYGALGIGSNVAIWLLGGWLLGDFLGAFVLLWWTRLLISHHLTWFVNSLAHCWGERTYSKEHSAVDNYILAFLTVGEGYHNYHHTFASDYRNGVRWYHFDPTKWTIWTLSKIGLARDLRRFSSYRIRKRLLHEDRKLLLEALKRHANSGKLELEARVQQLAECIQSKLGEVRSLSEELKRLKKTGSAARAVLELKRLELVELRRSLREDWRSWSALCGAVLEPLAAGA